MKSLIIAANKLDLVKANPSTREVFIEDIAAFQKDANFNDDISYLEISAKDNPSLPFQVLIAKIKIKQAKAGP